MLFIARGNHLIIMDFHNSLFQDLDIQQPNLHYDPACSEVVKVESKVKFTNQKTCTILEPDASGTVDWLNVDSDLSNNELQ